MSQIDELKALAIEADQRGDQQTAMMVMDKIEQLMAQQSAQITEQPGIFSMIPPEGAQLPPGAGRAMGGEGYQRVLEPIATMVTGAIAQPISGIAGIPELLAGQPEAAGQTIQNVQQALTYQPSPQGRESMQAIGAGINKITDIAAEGPARLAAGLTGLVGKEGAAGEAYQGIKETAHKSLGEIANEQGAPPVISALLDAAPTALMGAFALKNIMTKPGVQLLDNSGQPTLALRKMLDKKGLVYEDLAPEVQKMIPQTAGKSLVPMSGVNQASEEIIKQQIKAGGRQEGLAGLKIAGERVVVDSPAKEAMRQGFTPNIVQMVKTTDPETRAKMLKMTNMNRIISKNASAIEKIGRPTDMIGESVTDRIMFLRDKASSARKQLDNIARTRLKGKQIDAQAVIGKFEDSLNKLGVKLEDSGTGIPKPVFKGSFISKNPTAQKAVKDAIDLLAEGGTPDALRAHNLKRQLDELIDFRSKSQNPLTGTAKDILKDLRSSLNDAVRNVDSGYAKVNDTMSTSLKAIESLDDVTGKIDLFSDSAKTALGTKMRALTSNMQGRGPLIDSLKIIQDATDSLGGKFGDNIYDLVHYANELEKRFGPIAKSSLGGELEKAVSGMARQGVTATAREKIIEKGAAGMEKLRRINDFNAYESMAELLKAGGK